MIDRDPMMNDRDKKRIPTTFRTGFIGTFLVFFSCIFLFQLYAPLTIQTGFPDPVFSIILLKKLMDSLNSRLWDPDEISRD